MSFNIATRLNNLQYQINQKAGNPLTTDLDCDNNSIIDCKTLHYTALDPPVATSTSTIEEILQTGDDAGGENIQNVGTISLAQQNFQDLDLVNQDVVISQLSGLGNRLNVYMASDITSPFNSSATLATGQLITTSGITCNGTCSVAGGMNVGSAQVPSNLTLDGALVINQDGVPTGQTTLSANSSNQLVLSGGLQVGNLSTGSPASTGFHSIYPGDGFKYTGLYSKSVGALGIGTLGITNNSPTQTPTGNLECNNITCSQLNYTTLNPPISGASENLSQVLTNGNDAGGIKITNLGTPTVSTDATTKAYVDSRTTQIYNQTFTATGTITFNSGALEVGTVTLPTIQAILPSGMNWENCYIEEWIAWETQDALNFGITINGIGELFNYYISPSGQIRLGQNASINQGMGANQAVITYGISNLAISTQNNYSGGWSYTIPYADAGLTQQGLFFPTFTFTYSNSGAPQTTNWTFTAKIKVVDNGVALTDNERENPYPQFYSYARQAIYT